MEPYGQARGARECSAAAASKEWAWAMDFLSPVFRGRPTRHTAAQDAADLATIA